MTNETDLPTTLRTLRAKLALTQEQLAERLGVSFATVNRWEAGASKPQRAQAQAIAALAQESGVEGDTADAEGAPILPRRGRRAAATTTPTTKPMEQMLWDAACSIRGEKDAAKFKDYLLPLLFLKRLSDVFDDEITRLAEDYGDRATALEIAESDHGLLRFYLPVEARWAVISGRETIDWPKDAQGRSTAPRDIGEHLTRAVRAVVKHNPDLSGVLDVVDFAAERNGERDINPAKLRGVVETFSDPRYRLGLADVQPDFLGRAYEYLLRKFAEGSGQSAGEFFTPTEVGFLMAHILRPRPGETCHDYACGSAGLLIKLQLVARELDPTSRVPVKLSGQELQAESYAVARMNAIIHDMEVELARGDTMINPKFRDAAGKIRGHDIVVANPMWNQPFAPDLFKNDPFERFQTAGGITSGKGDWAWLQHTLACLAHDGRAAVVLGTGAVTRGSGSKNEDKERNVRKWFVDHDLIDGVILLPENLFYNTTAAGVIVVLNKRKPAARKGRITLLNASQHFSKGRPKNYLPEEDIKPLAAMYLKGEAVEGEVEIITTQQAEEADYNLSPSRWVGQNGSAEVGSIPALIQQLEQLNAQDLSLTADLLKLLRPLSNVEEAQ
ncbi:MAG: N-6 DNA methylase [Burkholderiaceae bacterium]